MNSTPPPIEQFEAGFRKIGSHVLTPDANNPEAQLVMFDYVHQDKNGVSMKISSHYGGTVSSVEYFLDDKPHNLDESTPAVRFWYSDGQLEAEVWSVNGMRNNPSPQIPAWRAWHKDGRVRREVWFRYGKMDDPDSFTPALREWDEDGNLTFDRRFSRGQITSAWRWQDQ